MSACMRALLLHSHRPHLPDPVTHTVDRFIATFGDAHDKAMAEVEKCHLLADGPDDIVVLLERPATGHDYNTPFAEFVSCSQTLRALDELIRFATRTQPKVVRMLKKSPGISLALLPRWKGF